MALDDFSATQEERKHLNGDDEEVRPRVSQTTHVKVRDFTSRAGLNIREAYDYLIGASLSDQEVLEEILTLDKEYSEQLSSMQKELLKDVALKWKQTGHFPTRDEINKDPEMNGFPIYVIHLGKTDRIKRLTEEHYAEEIDE